MTPPFGVDDLKGIWQRRIDALPAHRKSGPNTRYRIQDAAVGACGVFFTQSPSFLDSQRHLQQSTGHNKACTLFGVETIPCHTQRRNLRDPMLPSALNGVYLEVFAALEPHGVLRSFRGLSDHLLLALDGTQDFSSTTLHCRNCLKRHPSKGQTLYYHRAIPPVIVCPGRSEVMALPPACIMPQDGHDKQDCERGAGTRWIDKHAKQGAPYGVTWLGAARYRKQPRCQWALHQGCNFLFVCKPASHATRYERVAVWQTNDAIKALETRHRHGRFIAVTLYRYLNDVFLRGGPDALAVHGLERTSVNTKTGEPLSHNRFLTTHRLSAETVSPVAQAGRGRWKVEHDNTNGRKTKGDHLEHHFGHGQKYLAAFLLSLHVLAFLFHTVLPGCDAQYALRRQVLGRRQTFSRICAP